MVKILNTGKKGAEDNMRLDQKFLEGVDPNDDIVLHLYDWERPAFTHGFFLNPKKVLTKGGDFDSAKRPTGGGILFHMWDFAFSLIIPSKHPGYSKDVMANYRFVHELIIRAMHEMPLSRTSIHLLPEDMSPIDDHAKNFCFAKPTKYDVMIDGKKSAGGAQRRKRNGYLHQGSISIVYPDFSLLEQVLPSESRVLDAMRMHTHAFLEQGATESQIEEVKQELRSHLQKILSEV